jgi:hypothetical protein
MWVIGLTVAGLIIAPVDTAHLYTTVISGIDQFIHGLGLH